jgi:Recombinase zinc beta ribbon domain
MPSVSGAFGSPASRHMRAYRPTALLRSGARRLTWLSATQHSAAVPGRVSSPVPTRSSSSRQWDRYTISLRSNGCVGRSRTKLDRIRSAAHGCRDAAASISCSAHLIYVGTNAYGRSRTYRYYTCWTRSRYGVDHCAAPRIDADALDAKVLDAVRDFYTNRLDQARSAIAAAQAQHRQARAAYEEDLATVEQQLAAKEAIVDRYLGEYEDNKIDRDTVARRIEKISEQIPQLRHQRDELAFLLDAASDEPDGTHLVEIRDRVIEIIDTASGPERKAMCETLLAELRIDGSTATPVIRVPLSRGDTPSILQEGTRTAVRKAVRLSTFGGAEGTRTPDPHTARVLFRPISIVYQRFRSRVR